MLMKVLSANAATSASAEKISGQTNKQINRQTNKQDKIIYSKGTGDYNKHTDKPTETITL